MKKISFLLLAGFIMVACESRNYYGTDHSAIDGVQIYFEFDSADITPESGKKLEDIAEYMRIHKDVKIAIEGNADPRGAAEYNIGLAALRASNAGLVIMHNGVKPSRIDTTSFGKERASKKSGEEVWSRERNVTIWVD